MRAASPVTIRYARNQCGLFGLRGMQQLSSRLFESTRTLQELADRRFELYREWDVQKPSGGLRHIESPRPSLKRVQARIAQLLMRLEPPAFLYCPVKGRDFVQNALNHARANAIWCIDVKDYFASTTVANVHSFYADRMNCADDIAWLLTKLSTHNGHLPTGSPLSPILSYYANEPLWDEVRAIAASAECMPSLYMDDLTISGDDVPWNTVQSPVRKALNQSGFFGHKEVSAKGTPALVTGIMVGVGKATLPPKHFQKFRERMRVVSSADRNADEIDAATRSLTGMRELRRLVDRRRAVMT